MFLRKEEVRGKVVLRKEEVRGKVVLREVRGKVWFLRRRTLEVKWF